MCGIAAFILLDDGKEIFLASFLMILAYVLVDARRFSGVFQIDTVWLASYTALVISEGFFDSEILSPMVGQDTYLLAARYLNIINAMMLIGFNMKTRIWPEASSIVIKRLEPGWMYKWIIAAMYSAYLYVNGKYALVVLLNGRNSITSGEVVTRSGADLFNIYLGSFGLFLPAAVAYHVLFLKNYSKRQGAFILLLAYLPIFLIQAGIGVRSPIITSIVSVLVVYNAKHPFGQGRAFKLGAFSGLVVILTLWMKAFRGADCKARSQ